MRINVCSPFGVRALLETDSKDKNPLFDTNHKPKIWVRGGIWVGSVQCCDTNATFNNTPENLVKAQRGNQASLRLDDLLPSIIRCLYIVISEQANDLDGDGL